MTNYYYRICETITDYGKYIPVTDDLFKHVKHNKPFYQSIYMYNEDQVTEAKKTIEVEKDGKKYKRPRGISGFTDVVTKKLVFDFDSKDINESKQDAIEIVKRLTEKGFMEEDLGIFFSGGKGFHVEVETDTLLTPHQAKSIAVNLSDGLKTFDSVVYNAARVFRVPYTKHKSGYYKTRLTYQELINRSVQEVLEIAKEAYEPEGLKEVHLPSSLLSLAEKKKEKPNNLDEELFENFTIDLSNKPAEMSNWKYALSQGLFKDGSKHNARLILAATFRGMGLNKQEAYYRIKAAADIQSRRFGEERTTKDLIYSVIDHVYSSLWEGGTYAEDNFPQAIVDFLEECGVPRFSEVEIDEDLVVDVDQGFENFFDYAVNIDKNRLNFGIPELDRILKPQKGHLIGLLAGPGIGKCQKINTPILMFDGSIKKVQDVVVGDLLMGPDSKPRKVLSLARGEEEMFDIIPKKGDVWGCNKSHILSLRCSTDVNKTYRRGNIYNISVGEYLELPKKTREKLKQYRVGVEFSNLKNLPVTPYTLGVWLAEDDMSGVSFTCGDIEVRDKIKSEAVINKVKFNTLSGGTNAYRFSLTTENGKSNPVWSFIKDFTCDGIKRIPFDYKTSSRENRLELLAGLLDGDGHLINGCFEIITKYKEMSDDILFLSRSLGFAAYSSLKKVKLPNWSEYRDYHRIIISGDLNIVPTKVSRKKARPGCQIKNVLNTDIEVVPTGVGEYYGFTLDGDSLYCLGDFTVTHNTSMALELLSNTSKDGCHSLFGSYDMNSSILFQKLLQRETRLSDDEIYDIYRNNDQEKIGNFKNILKKHYENVTFCFKVGQTIGDLKRTIAQREQVLGEKIGLVVIDYIELILSDKSDATQASAEAAQGLREIANSGKVVVVLLQPNKMSSKPDEAPKTYNAAKGSSAIAQAVTSMMGCFRPGYNPEDTAMDKFFGVAILKNRMGPLGTCYFDWHGPTGRITQLEDIQRQELDEFLKWKNAKDSEENSGGLL